MACLQQSTLSWHRILDCLSDGKLEAILSPYIGTIAPFNFAKSHDPFIQTAHWSGAEELLETCRQLAEQQPNGYFPSESWLRKRGKYKDREGPVYNSLALYVNERLGGLRNVRKLLGHEQASTTAWTPELLIEAWRDFDRRFGCLPATPRGSPRFEGSEHASMRREASRLWEAARRHGVLEECKAIGTKRPLKWTPETTAAAWYAFEAQHGKQPSGCLSAGQRERLPRNIYAEATRIYGAARRLGLLHKLRSENV